MSEEIGGRIGTDWIIVLCVICLLNESEISAT